MNDKQVQKFVVAYLEKTGSQIVEKSPTHVTVKLSPEADRALTNRPFYWSFVDRTGVEPETLMYAWTFGKTPPPDPAHPSTPLRYMMTSAGRVIREEVYFGSQRLLQLFGAVRAGGRCVTMFEEPPRGKADPLASTPYTAWLGVNFKVGYACDVRREELHGWGISLATGVIDDRFLDKLRGKRLTPRLPAGVHLLPNGLSLRKGMMQLELALERKLKAGDFAWAEQAEERRLEELSRLRAYYEPMIAAAKEPDEQRAALQERLERRSEEIDWQYRPRITAEVVNCGLFHLPGID